MRLLKTTALARPTPRGADGAPTTAAASRADGLTRRPATGDLVAPSDLLRRATHVPLRLARNGAERWRSAPDASEAGTMTNGPCRLSAGFTLPRRGSSPSSPATFSSALTGGEALDVRPRRSRCPESRAGRAFSRHGNAPCSVGPNRQPVVGSRERWRGSSLVAQVSEPVSPPGFHLETAAADRHDRRCGPVGDVGPSCPPDGSGATHSALSNRRQGPVLRTGAAALGRVAVDRRGGTLEGRSIWQPGGDALDVTGIRPGATVACGGFAAFGMRRAGRCAPEAQPDSPLVVRR